MFKKRAEGQIRWGVCEGKEDFKSVRLVQFCLCSCCLTDYSVFYVCNHIKSHVFLDQNSDPPTRLLTPSETSGQCHNLNSLTALL
ncbi:hypothetical protein AB3S75_017095 [Citrus x aurantiifolia]